MPASSTTSPHPPSAQHHCRLVDDARLRDVVLMVFADEAHHCDVNHALASQLAAMPADAARTAPYPQHTDGTQPRR